MAKIKFYLKDSSLKETAIFARISYGATDNNTDKKKYIQLKYYISLSINPNFWNTKTNRARETKDFPQYPEFNARLNVIESTINSKILKLENSSTTLSNEVIKKELDTILKPEIIKAGAIDIKQMSFFQFIDHLIKTSPNKKTTLKSFRVVEKNLVEYQKAKKKKLTFQNIDIDFYNSFVDYLTKNLKLSKNTIGTRIKILKTFMNQAYESDIIVNTDYKKRAFKKPTEQTQSIYLSESELMQMYNIESTPESIKMLKQLYNRETLSESLTKIRDIFLIGCYTGLRFSDLTRLTKENINTDNTISIKTIKTEQNIVVPIHPIVKQILIKYNYNLPRIPTNQKFNEYIKDVAKLAQIKDLITIESTKGGFRVSETVEKHKVVTSHTARRSFATNAFLSDMPSISIMRITGHKTESAFMTYLKMSAKDNAIKMQSHPFFNKMIIAK